MAGRFVPLKLTYTSAPATRASSPENIRKLRYAAELQRQLTQMQHKTESEDYAPVAVSDPQPSTEEDRGSLVTPQCLLFVVTTSLLFLSMTVMMVVVILHLATGGKIFSSKTHRKNSTGPQEQPPFNFFHVGGSSKVQ